MIENLEKKLKQIQEELQNKLQEVEALKTQYSELIGALKLANALTQDKPGIKEETENDTVQSNSESTSDK